MSRFPFGPSRGFQDPRAQDGRSADRSLGENPTPGTRDPYLNDDRPMPRFRPLDNNPQRPFQPQQPTMPSDSPRLSMPYSSEPPREYYQDSYPPRREEIDERYRDTNFAPHQSREERPPFSPYENTPHPQYQQHGYTRQLREEANSRFSPHASHPTGHHQDLSFWREEEPYPYFSQDPERYSQDRPSPLRFVFAITGLILIAGLSWFAYRWASQSHYDPPTIHADQAPYKIKPENPGGIHIPHQDKLIYGRLTPNGEQPTERLLPMPEAPSAIPPSSHAQPMMSQPQPMPQASHNISPQMVPSQQPSLQETVPNAIYPPAGNVAINQPMPVGPQQQTAPSFQQNIPPVSPTASVNMPQEATHNSYVQNGMAVNDTASSQPTQPSTPSLPAVPASPNTSIETSQKKLQDVLNEDENNFSGRDNKVESKNRSSTTSTGQFYVQLGTLPNETSAKQELTRLKSKYASELAGVKGSIRFYDMPDGRKYRVMAGPFRTRSQALKKCQDIGHGCRVAEIPPS